jgi:hypothetical protein
MSACRVQIYLLTDKHIKKELSNLCRLNFQQVLLYDILEKAIQKLNPFISLTKQNHIVIEMMKTIESILLTIKKDKVKDKIKW